MSVFGGWKNKAARFARWTLQSPCKTLQMLFYAAVSFAANACVFSYSLKIVPASGWCRVGRKKDLGFCLVLASWMVHFFFYYFCFVCVVIMQLMLISVRQWHIFLSAFTIYSLLKHSLIHTQARGGKSNGPWCRNYPKQIDSERLWLYISERQKRPWCRCYPSPWRSISISLS